MQTRTGGKRAGLRGWIVAVAAGVGLGLTVGAVFGSPFVSSPAGAFTLIPANQPGTAATLADAVTRSDLVVVGVVESSTEGRVIGDGEAELVFYETALRVNEVRLDNNTGDSIAAAPGQLVLVETEAVVGDGKTAPPQVGAEVLAFLWQKRDADSAGKYFRPITPGAWFYVDADGSLRTVLDTGRVELDAAAGEIQKAGFARVNVLTESANATGR